MASHAIGSVPFLLREGENGLIYKNGDENGLLDRVVQLIEQPEMRKRLGRKAYQTLTEQWNGRNRRRTLSAIVGGAFAGPVARAV